MYVTENKTFLKNIEDSAVSEIWGNASCDLMALSVSGDFTAISLTVESKTFPEASDWVTLTAFDTGNGFADKTTIISAGDYLVSVVGTQQLRINVASVIGGKATVFAKFINTGERD